MSSRLEVRVFDPDESRPDTPHLRFASDADLLRQLAFGAPIAPAALSVLRERHLPALTRYARLCVIDDRFSEPLAQQSLSAVARDALRGRLPYRALRPTLLTVVQEYAAQWGQDERLARLGPSFVHWISETTDGGTFTPQERLANDALARAFNRLPVSEQEILWYAEVERGGPETALLHAGGDDFSYRVEHALNGLRRTYLQAYATTRPLASECRGSLRIIETRARGKGAPVGTADEHLTCCVACAAAVNELTTLYEQPRAVLVPALIGFAGQDYLRAGVAPRPRAAGSRKAVAAVPPAGRRLIALVTATGVVALLVAGAAIGLRHTGYDSSRQHQQAVSPAPHPHTPSTHPGRDHDEALPAPSEQPTTAAPPQRDSPAGRRPSAASSAAPASAAHSPAPAAVCVTASAASGDASVTVTGSGSVSVSAHQHSSSGSSSSSSSVSSSSAGASVVVTCARGDAQ
ncbi:hypothetical protein ACWC24_32685 [Streptomyces sp. NPDC001443]